MNLTTSNIKKTALAVFKRKKIMAQPQRVNPSRDWFVGMSVGVAILVGIMAWSSYMYVSNRSGKQFHQNQEVTVPTVYRAATVAAALEYYEARQVTFSTVAGETTAATASEPTITQPVSTSTDPSSLDATDTDIATDTTDVVAEDIVDDSVMGTPTVSE